MSVFNSFIYSPDSTTITGFDGEPGNNCSVQFIDNPESSNKVTNVNITTDLSSFVTGLIFDFTGLASLQTITNVCDNLTNLQAAIVSVDVSDSEQLMINDYAFVNCTGLRTVNMSGSTGLIILNSAFVNTGLRTVDMSESTGLTINDDAFNNCSTLQTVNMSGSTGLTINGDGSGAFVNCTGLRTVNMSGSTGLTINSYAFNNCSTLQTVDMSSSKNLAFDGEATFNNCTSLSEITFPVGLTILDAKALLWTDLINNYLPPPEYVKYYLNSTQEDALNISITNLDSIENLPNNLTYSSGVLSGSIINSGTFPVTFNVDTDGGGGDGGLEGDGGVGDLEGGGGGGISVEEVEGDGGGVDEDIGGIFITINFVNVNTLVCFLPGSQILINQDPVTYKAIEDLVETDSVISCFTHTPVSIKKCVKHAVRLQELESTNVPYVIPKDFFGSNTPNQDVYLSGHHRIIFNLNDNSKLGVQTFKIDGLKPAVIANEELYYYHIELNSEDTDGVICSNIPVEALEHG
jgi:hypothetical protein